MNWSERMTKTHTIARTTVFCAGLCSLVVLAAEHVNPNQAEIEALNDKKALLEAKEAISKAENSLAKSEFEAFPDNFGKKGNLTLSGTDTVRVTAKTALAMKQVAKQIANLLKAESGSVVLLTDADRMSIPVYKVEKDSADRLLSAARKLLEDGPPVAAESAELLALGTMLSQFAQFTQLFRTDKTVSFVQTTLPDDLLLELISANAPNALYAAADLDGLLAGRFASLVGKTLTDLARARDSLKQIADPKKKEAATALSAQIDEGFKRLMSNNEAAKTLCLLVVLRGELVSGYLDAANGREMSVRILAQGGTTIKTESIWRSDRYYVSGSIVASYRLISTAPSGSVMKADVISSDGPFDRIPLE